jgi:hypothetical protein
MVPRLPVGAREITMLLPSAGSAAGKISMGIAGCGETARSMNWMRPTLLSRLRQMIFTGVAYRSAQQTQEQERPMGAVMVRCPETGRDIPTGLVTDRKSFDATPVFFGRVHCPICRTEHEWFAKEAWVCEAEPRPRRSALL